MAFTVTNDVILPSTVTGSWPRPRWFDVSMWGRPLDTCMMDVRFREKFQDALAVVIGDEERAGLDIHTSKYKDNREVVWDMAVAMNTELLALRDAGCRCMQIEEPTLHFMANTFGATD